jgi:hypothetical protein
LTLISFSLEGLAEELCSRTVEINSQEVLIDLNSTQKGEGLKSYLEKDPQANSYYEKYQEGNKFEWQDTLLGTGGALAVLTGLSLGSQNTSKNTFIIAGASMIALQFILGYSIKRSNETNLEKAIDEYNKRNFPKINVSENVEKNIYLAHTWEF